MVAITSLTIQVQLTATNILSSAFCLYIKSLILFCSREAIEFANWNGQDIDTI